MEIAGKIIKITDTYIRLETISKKQEVDVFFPESKWEPLELLFEPHMLAVLVVEVQSLEHDGNKLAKLWIKHVRIPFLYSDEDLNEAQKRRYDKISILYKKEDLKN